MTLLEKLVGVQSQMKAPKNLRNTFGGYNYRNAEQIFEAFKPFGAQLGLALTVTDEVIQIGTAVYVKATATLFDMECPADRISVSALAREPENKKGMDAAQVTGATSSYARKYALNGLFLLDDTKDPDSDEYRVQDENMQKKKKQQKDPVCTKLIAEITALMMSKGYPVTQKAAAQLDSMDVEALKETLSKTMALPDKTKGENK